jgi:hypothetical protein
MTKSITTSDAPPAMTAARNINPTVVSFRFLMAKRVSRFRGR